MAGIFVGGASSRMGGHAKGLLRAPDGGTLIARWRAVFAELGIGVVLVGRRAEYADVDLPQLDDDPPGTGPLGGLAALIAHAAPRRAIAVACDMPFVPAEDLERLLAAGGSAAPRREGRWEPLCAVYAADALPVLRDRIAAGALSLQALLDELAPTPVALPARHLDDWDAPEDLPD